jgi:hypothetical protein
VPSPLKFPPPNCFKNDLSTQRVAFICIFSRVNQYLCPLYLLTAFDILHPVLGAPAAFASTAMFAPQANQLVHKFIQSLPSSLSVLCSPNPMHTALANMARFSGDSPFTTRDPQSCWSFSRVAPELVKFTDDMYVFNGSHPSGWLRTAICLHLGSKHSAEESPRRSHRWIQMVNLCESA